ncbi:MAG: endolytic transglycosylase MltG [Candidatus Levybacteria bacterium CG10_big_fil_rev_8_21_14_0_10_35_13]|nr:MAG: endolytic transglycosylase MltG [Candidatus Levybacteria bacterium CG10_big_fil_rev_8_21_14_0_10_35_13]
MKKLIIVSVLILIAAVFGLIWWQSGNLAVNSSDKTPVIFVIKNGDGVREIANNLKQQRLIRDPVVFFLLTKQGGLDKQIQAGDFRLNRSMTALEIAKALTHGTLDIWVTLPEGVRAEEIADILEEKMPQYDKSWREVLNENEGYLFPDTYLLPREADIELIVSILKNNFQTKYESVKNLKTTSLSDEETLILASMIEREARHAEDHSLVASVITNRLEIGMKLDIDATLQYALGFQEDENRWWKKGLASADKKINSPYNTYVNAGLPPAPISNPGLSAIQAALKPAKTNYLYYITDESGKNRYSTTLEGHNENIEKYGLN